MNTVEMNQMQEAYMSGLLSKETLDFMIQTGALSIIEWFEIQSCRREIMTTEEIKEKYGIRSKTIN